MLRIRLSAFVAKVVLLSGSILSAAPVPSAAVPPQQPTVSWEVFRVDVATGALIPLESAKPKKEKRGGYVYCHIEGAHSPVTIQQGEPLVFATRYEGSPKNVDLFRAASWSSPDCPLGRLEFLSVSDSARRYATQKYAPMEGEPYGEVVSGVNPKKQKHVGQAFVFKPLGPLPQGEYGLRVAGCGGMLTNGADYYFSVVQPDCAEAVSAFRIVEGVPTQRTPSPPIQSPTDAGLTKGIAQVQEEHWDDAVSTLNDVVKRLSATPASKEDLAQAYLWLGITYAQLDLEKSSIANIREALKLDPTVSLAEGWPPKVLRMFEAAKGKPTLK